MWSHLQNIIVVMVLRYALLIEAADTTLNAVVLGRKDDVNMEYYMKIATALDDQRVNFCRINFTAIEYDTTNGSTVYQSHKLARATFENKSFAVAIGPQIDVFTSTDYVILHQIHLVTSSDQFIKQTNRTVSILPDPRSLSKAIAEVIKFLEWNKVAFLSQDDFSPVQALGSANIFVSPIRLPSDMSFPDNPQLQQTLTTLRESQTDRFILHSMNINVVKMVIKAAQKLHLLHHSIKWFITYLDFETVAKEFQGTFKVYGLQLLNSRSEGCKLFENESLSEVLFEGNVSKLQQGLMCDVIGILRHYLNTTDCSKQPEKDAIFNSELFQSKVKNAVFKYSGALGTYNWHAPSNIRTEYSIPIYRYIEKLDKVADVVIGEKETKVYYLMSKDDPHIINPFMNKTFEVIAKQDEPFVMKKKDGTYEGFCVDVLQELSKKLGNFKYRIFEVENRTKKQNGHTASWDDIIKQLKDGNAAMALGAFAVTAERESKVSFSYTVISSSVSLLVKKPPNTVNYFQFLGPFGRDLWIMIVAFFVLVGLGLYFMARFDSTQNGSEQKFDLKESMWYSLTVLLQGSTEFSPQTTCMRTIIAFFWFCTLVINAAYTANLAAFLTLQQIDNRITSVDNLARQTITKYGVLNNSDLMHFFSLSRDDPYERMWASMKLNDEISLLPDREVGMQYVMEKDYIFLDDGVINKYLAQRNCEIESIEQNFGAKHFSIGFPKGAPYRSDIDQALLLLKEDGTLDSLRNKWWSNNCTDDSYRSSANTASELGIPNMFGVFIVLIAFTVLAVLYEFGEFIWKVFANRQKKKQATEEAGASKEDKQEANNIKFGLSHACSVEEQ